MDKTIQKPSNKHENFFLEKKKYITYKFIFYMKKKMRFEHDKKQFAVKRRFHNACSLLFFCFFAIFTLVQNSYNTSLLYNAPN